MTVLILSILTGAYFGHKERVLLRENRKRAKISGISECKRKGMSFIGRIFGESFLDVQEHFFSDAAGFLPSRYLTM